MTEVFLSGNEPYEYDEYYVEVPVNRNNRMLATRFTDPEDVEKLIFLNYPAEASAWAAKAGIESMPTEYDPIRDSEQQAGIQITSPASFQSYAVSESIDVIVRLDLPEAPESFQVSVGQGMYPESWQEMCRGAALENGRWLLCSLDGDALTPGLHALRAAFISADNKYQSAETYFEINAIPEE